MSQVISETATLSDYWAIVRRHARLIVISTVAGALIAAIYSFITPGTYVAQASVVIGRIQSDPFASTRLEDISPSTERNVVRSTVVAELAAEKLDETDPVALLQHVTVENPADTLILDISFSAKSPARARDGAQAFATSYLTYRRDNADATKERQLEQLDAQITANRDDLQSAIATANDTTASASARSAAEARRGVLTSRIGDLEAKRAEIDATDTTPGELIRPAERPSGVDGPGAALTTLGGAMLGLLGGLTLALIRDRADRRLLGHRELVDLLDEEPLAEGPATRRADRRASSVACEREPDGVTASEFRRLRARVWPDRAAGPRRVLIVAPRAGDAADVVGANLAITFASLGWSTALSWQERGIPDGLFANVPEEADTLPHPSTEADVQLIELPDHRGLWIVPALGRGTESSPIEATTRQLSEIADMVQFQIVLCDPVLTSPQAVELAPLVDGVIVAFDAQTTARADLVRALEVLGTLKVIGVVATNVTGRWTR